MPQLNSLFWFLLRDYCHQLNLWKLNWSGGLPVLNCTEDRNTCKYSSTCWCFCLATKSSDLGERLAQSLLGHQGLPSQQGRPRQYRPMKLGQYASKWTTTDREWAARQGTGQKIRVCVDVWSHLTQDLQRQGEESRARRAEMVLSGWWTHLLTRWEEQQEGHAPPNSTTSFTYTRKILRGLISRNTRNVSYCILFWQLN